MNLYQASYFDVKQHRYTNIKILAENMEEATLKFKKYAKENNIEYQSATVSRLDVLQ